MQVVGGGKRVHPAKPTHPASNIVERGDAVGKVRFIDAKVIFEVPALTHLADIRRYALTHNGSPRQCAPAVSSTRFSGNLSERLLSWQQIGPC